MRVGGSLKYEDHTIQVFLDLAPDVLAKRRVLKPITECLHSNKVRFPWSPTSDIPVFKDGCQLRANDLSSGKDLLAALLIRPPADLADQNPNSSSSHDKA